MPHTLRALGPTGGAPATGTRGALGVALATVLALIPGGAAVAAPSAPVSSPPAGTATPVEEALEANTPHHDDPSEHDWDAGSEVPVSLSDQGINSDGPGVQIDGSTVTVTAAGTYRFTGSLSDGQIVVDTTEAGMVRLVLENAAVTSSTGTPLNVVRAEEAMVVMADFSSNELTGTAPPTPTEDPDTPPPAPAAPKAALSSSANLTLLGYGALTVTSADRDGIASKDGLVIAGVELTVNAADDGIRGKNYLVVNGGTISVKAGGKGLASSHDTNARLGYVLLTSGDVTVESGSSAVHASTDALISGGSLSAVTGGGSTQTVPEDSSARGVHGKAMVIVDGGTVAVDCADTAIHSQGQVILAGGEVSVASSRDGIHGDQALEVRDGDVTVTQSREGLDALKLSILGGRVTVTATNDAVNSSQEGYGEFDLAPDALITVAGGNLTVTSGDDGLDSNGHIVITGGATYITPAFDGIDANGTLTLSGGTVVVNGSPDASRWQTGLEIIGGIRFTGGTLLAAGAAATFTPPAATSPQSWAYFRLAASQPEGSVLHLVDEAGVVTTYEAGRDFQSVLFTSPRIVKGLSYDVYLGGTPVGDPVGGMYPTGDLTGAEKVATVVAGEYRPR